MICEHNKLTFGLSISMLSNKLVLVKQQHQVQVVVV